MASHKLLPALEEKPSLFQDGLPGMSARAGRAPTTTWVGVRALANKEFLIEIEAIAVIE